jgi:hypothetical protein
MEKQEKHQQERYQILEWVQPVVVFPAGSEKWRRGYGWYGADGQIKRPFV